MALLSTWQQGGAPQLITLLAMSDLHLWVMLFFTCIISTLLALTIFSKTRTKVRLPPSPMALPILGHLHLLGSTPHRSFHELSNYYGPLMHIRLGSTLCVVASSPEIAKQLLKTNELCFSDRPRAAATQYLDYGSDGFIFAPYGRYVQFMKKFCMSELLSSRTLDQFSSVRNEEIRRLIKLLLKKSESKEEVNMNAELMRMANNVISRMTMSSKCSETQGEAEVIRKWVKEAAELAGTFNLADIFGFLKGLDLQGWEKRLKYVHEGSDEFIERIIEEHQVVRRKKKEMSDDDDRVKDFLDRLLDMSEDSNAEKRLTRENIKAVVLGIFAAGTFPPAIVTEWALAELINHPIVLEKAREEINSIVEKNRLVEESDITNLPYLQTIVKETLRLHPPGPLLVRQSAQDCKIQGYDIPANTKIFVNVWSIGRDPKYWEDPLEFRPERFIQEHKKGCSQLDFRGQHFHFLPFGSGRRGCPGISLGLQMAQASLAAMIQCFDWKVGDGKENVVVDMRDGIGLSVPKAHPLVCFPVARLNPFPLLAN